MYAYRPKLFMSFLGKGLVLNTARKLAIFGFILLSFLGLLLNGWRLMEGVNEAGLGFRDLEIFIIPVFVFAAILVFSHGETIEQKSRHMEWKHREIRARLEDLSESSVDDGFVLDLDEIIELIPKSIEPKNGYFFTWKIR
jgi:hypothetical protein